jgi:hypothetical protein
MNNIILVPGKFYRILFADGQPIDIKCISNDSDTNSVRCEKKAGETFYLDTVEPVEKIIEIEGW